MEIKSDKPSVISVCSCNFSVIETYHFKTEFPSIAIRKNTKDEN
jgi:hypothetical protein